MVFLLSASSRLEGGFNAMVLTSLHALWLARPTGGTLQVAVIRPGEGRRVRKVINRPRWSPFPAVELPKRCERSLRTSVTRRMPNSWRYVFRTLLRHLSAAASWTGP